MGQLLTRSSAWGGLGCDLVLLLLLLPLRLPALQHRRRVRRRPSSSAVAVSDQHSDKTESQSGPADRLFELGLEEYPWGWAISFAEDVPGGTAFRSPSKGAMLTSLNRSDFRHFRLKKFEKTRVVVVV